MINKLKINILKIDMLEINILKINTRKITGAGELKSIRRYQALPVEPLDKHDIRPKWID